MNLPPELDKIWRGNPLPAPSLVMETYIAGYAAAVKDADELMLCTHPDLGTIAECARRLRGRLAQLKEKNNV